MPTQKFGWFFLLIMEVSLVTSASCVAQSSDGTDIWIGNLSQKDNVLAVSQLINITDRPGYDNQPFFLPDGEHLLYTSAQHGGYADKHQMDALLYDLANGRTINLTRSQASEYSPTLMPNDSHISVIRVDKQGKQKLWAYPLASGQPYELLKDIEPVGYQAWINPNEILLFVLGEPMRLERADISSGKSVVLDTQIGASLYRIPHTSSMSYSRSQSPENKNPIWQLMQYNPSKNSKQVLTNLPKGAYYYAWTPDGKALAAQKSQLKQWDRTQPKQQWQTFADVSQACPKGVSRMAVNSQQTRIALVCER